MKHTQMKLNTFKTSEAKGTEEEKIDWNRHVT